MRKSLPPTEYANLSMFDLSSECPYITSSLEGQVSIARQALVPMNLVSQYRPNFASKTCLVFGKQKHRKEIKPAENRDKERQLPAGRVKNISLLNCCKMIFYTIQF